MVRVIEALTEDWRRLDQRIDELSSEIEELAKRDPARVRLMSVPGIGPIISSAMVAAIGTGDGFSKGRDFAAWLGLVPKQISTGDRTILGSISKRGNRYLRVLFVQAAWVTLVKVSPNKWEGHGLKGSSGGSEPPRSDCTTTCLRSRLPTSSRVLLGACWLAVEASRRASFRRSNSSRVVESFYPPGLREDETRWRFGLPGACEHW